MANSEIALVIKYPEEKAEATLRAENPKEKVTSNNPDSSSKDGREESAVKDNYESNFWSPKPKVDENPKEESSLQNYWKKIFVASCLCGVLVDPLFLYVPLIKDDVKCLFFDQKLKIVAIILRSVTDLFYILDIIFRIFRIYGFENSLGFIEQLPTLRFQRTWRSCVPTIAKAIRESNDILIDILAILPLPQVVILIFFSNMRDLKSLTTTRMFIMNLFALLQYIPRVRRIYLSCGEPKRMGEIKQTPIWIKVKLYLSMSIIASHVCGALWYFFAIQRMMVCWHSACRKEGCDNISFGCHDHHTFRNIKILNDLCPINPPDAKMFDLGIFTSVLESDITGSTNYFQKFSSCFWWGLRNLSSLGSNLEPSINGWENLFTTSIFIIGLLLFFHLLLGNLQMYTQFENEKREELNRKLRVARKMEQIGREIELWLFKNGIPTKSHKEMKSQVSEKVQQAIEGNLDVNLDDVLPILRSAFQSSIKKCTPLTKLKQAFEGIDERVLREICQHLKPKKFKRNDIIIEEGTPELMVFIVDGLVNIEKRNPDGSCNNSQRGAGELCGQDLLLYGSRSNGEYAKAFGDVEALVIMTEDVVSVCSRFGEELVAYRWYLHVQKSETRKRQKVNVRKRSHDN